VLRVCAARDRVCAARDYDRGGPYGHRARSGTSHALCGAATRAPACGSLRCSRSARGNSSGRSRTAPDNAGISRGEAAACRASVSDRGDDKLAHGPNHEHRVLTVGVHRLRASGAYPGPLIFSASSPAWLILPPRSSRSRLPCRSTSTVRTRRDQAAINTSPTTPTRSATVSFTVPTRSC
jgi:hypothetical protein